MDHLQSIAKFPPRTWTWPEPDDPKSDSRPAKRRRTQPKKEAAYGSFTWKLPNGSECAFTVPLCMPEQYYREDAVEAYRAYYQSPEKAAINVWKYTEQPAWYGLKSAPVIV